MFIRDHSLEADDPAVADDFVADDFEAQADTWREVEAMQWSESQFNDVDDDPRHINMPKQQYRVATHVVGQDSAFGIFCCVFPISAWAAIAACTEKNRQARSHIVDKVRKDFKYHFETINTADVIVYFGLLLLNMLHGYKEGIASQWREHGTTVRSSGRFARWMTRDKFRVVGRYLVFHDIDLPVDPDDRHYRLRNVIEALLKAFRKCYALGKYISFDEATFACVSKYLPARIFNPMKPHRYGLKVFMTCCAVTGYCYKFEIYQGASGSASKNPDADAADKKSGPRALFRAMAEFKGTFRVAVCDRFYTSVMIFYQLLKDGIFAIGTIMPDRHGFPALCNLNSRASSLDRGYLMMASSVVPDGTFVAMGWMDSKPVHVLSTGTCNHPVSILRRVGRAVKKFTVPTVIRRYHKYMGGVDQSDFMRMARYSVQQSYHARYWYKSIFLSLFDLAITNAYILHNVVYGNKHSKNLGRDGFMYALAEGMVNYEVQHETRAAKRKAAEESPYFKGPDSHGSHRIMEIQAKEATPRRLTRSRTNKDAFGCPVMFGYSGEKMNRRICVVCSRTRKSRRSVMHYCNICHVAVCHNLTTRVDHSTGDEYKCWDDLHNNPDLIQFVDKKRRKRESNKLS